jgi:uncharacterized protein (DUF1778 family)
MCNYKQERATHQLHILIKPSEIEYIRDIAKRLGVSASQFIKTAAINEAKKIERDYLIPKGK